MGPGANGPGGNGRELNASGVNGVGGVVLGGRHKRRVSPLTSALKNPEHLASRKNARCHPSSPKSLAQSFGSKIRQRLRPPQTYCQKCVCPASTWRPH